MTCHRYAGGVVCLGGPDHEVTDARGKVWRFEFHEYLGPTVLRKDGSPYKRIGPPEGSSFWPAFEKWLRARRATEPPSTEPRLEIR
jgi:hypothetical protein